MGKGRPSLVDNPLAYRVFIRNFIDKYGLDSFRDLLKKGINPEMSKSKLSRELDISFGPVSKVHEAVFMGESDDSGNLGVRSDVKDFLSKFYGLMVT